MRMLTLLLGLSLVCCKGTKNQETSYIMVKMVKTQCFGTCPAYEVTVGSDGKVEYNGEAHVPYIGKRTFILTDEERDQVREEFEKTNFFSLKERYYSNVTDLPTTYVTYNDGQKSHEVMDYKGAPDRLKALERYVEELIFSKL